MPNSHVAPSSAVGRNWHNLADDVLQGRPLSHGAAASILECPDLELLDLLAAAYRVRDRLFEYDSSTCRICHVMEEIEPKRERGVNAHKKAVDEEKTCIECHYNEKHRPVDVPDDAFAREGDRDA